MKIGIHNPNAGKNKDFPKVVKQADVLPDGMYKAIFNRFITTGFQENKFEAGKIKFVTVFGWEIVEDMAGNKVADFWKEFDDGTREEGPRTLTRDYPLTDDLHHKSNGFAIAKALDPQVPTVRRGKEKEHEYIVEFDWEANLGKTVLLNVVTKKAEAGHFYNQVQAVMPLGVPLEARLHNTMFILYDNSEAMQKVYKEDVYPWEKKKITERIVLPQEPDVVHGAAPAPKNLEEGKQDPAPAAPAEPQPPMDFDDDIPF